MTILALVAASCGSSAPPTASTTAESTASTTSVQPSTTTTEAPPSIAETTLPLEPVIATDAFDNTVAVPADPKRVFAGDDTSLANLLELGIRPVGMRVNPNAVPDFLAEQLDGIVDVSADNGFAINLEALAALEPDLIIAPGVPLVQAQYGLATEIAPTYAYRYGYASSQELRTNLTDIAQLFRLEDRAAEIISELDTRIAELARRLADSDDPDRTVSVLRVFADGAGYSLRHGTTESVLMAEIGIVRPENQQSLEAFATDVSLETVSIVEADVIYVYVDDLDDTTHYDAIVSSPLWQRLSAVESGDVHLVDGGIWNGISIRAAHLILDDLERTLDLSGG